jgi:phosphate transport system permease protein
MLAMGLWHMIVPLFVGREKSVRAIERAMMNGKHIMLVSQKSSAQDDPGPDDVYTVGVIGMLFFGQLCHMGYSLLTGSLTLTLMVLPLVTRNTQEALKTVPDSFRTGAVGLGAGKWYTIRTILLPSAMPGIVTGVILAIGRIIGESAALLFTAGSAHLLPKTFNAFLEKIFHSGGTLTIQLYLSASKGEFEVAFGIAVVLLVIVLLINFGTKRLAKKLEKH